MASRRGTRAASAESGGTDVSTESDQGSQAETPAGSELLEIAYYYDHAKNENGGAFPGVPLRHLTASEVAAYPKWLVRSVEASAMYSKEAPPAPVSEESVESSTGDGETNS